MDVDPSVPANADPLPAPETVALGTSTSSTTLTAPPTMLTPPSTTLPPPAAPSTAASLVPCPDDAEPWFVKAREEMVASDLGCHFHALIAAWTRIEYASCFQNGPTNLPPKGRPKQVGAWIANGRLVQGRKRRADVDIPDTDEYALGWQKWWDSLQPKWRKRAKDGRWSMDEKYDGQDWGPLYHWGVNGVLNVVASLCFWGRCVVAKQVESDVRAWEVAVDDVTWLMENMATYYERFNRKF
ncbi:hypothetical protein DFH06DRAFT_999518 [Mycena polygramma]|nr:hypothetical protein DFH06DRAFT_999518 [Mycena polygramma]